MHFLLFFLFIIIFYYSAQACFHVWNNKWRQICFISQKTPKMASLLLPHWGSSLRCRQTHKQTHQLPCEEQDVAAPVRRAPQLAPAPPIALHTLTACKADVSLPAAWARWNSLAEFLEGNYAVWWPKLNEIQRFSAVRYDCMTKTPLSSATCSVYVSARWLMEVTDCCRWH